MDLSREEFQRFYLMPKFKVRKVKTVTLQASDLNMSMLDLSDLPPNKPIPKASQLAPEDRQFDW